MQCCDAPPLYCCNTLLKWIAVNEAIRGSWRKCVLPQPRQLLAVCSTAAYTPCLRLAPMKSSRSPSSTAFVLLISTFVRKSLMRLLSSTYERIW
jgi:hypothetical protein